MLPMLATPTTRPGLLPAGEGWSYEVKWDGMRVLAESSRGRLRLTSRRGNAVTAAYPELDAELLDGTVLDGEVVAVVDGLPSFAALAGRIHVRDRRRAAALAASVPVSYMVFDVLRLAGEDLTSRPLSERRQLLAGLELASARWQVPPVYDDGRLLLDVTRVQGLEGVVAKRLGSRYHPGRRSPDWVKLAHRSVLTCAVAGWVPQTDSTTVLGAVWLALPDGAGGWRCLGRCGSGLAGAAGVRMNSLLAGHARVGTPYSELPADPDVRRTTWCEPKVLVDVRYLGADEAGRLRQPAYRGVRDDLTPAELAGFGEQSGTGELS